jgi:hypothetical protein
MPNAHYMEIAGAAQGGLLSHSAEVAGAILDFFRAR